MTLRFWPVLIAAALSFAACAYAVPSSPQTDAPQTLTTTFTYSATISAPPSGTKTLRAWLPIPSNSVWQTVSGLHVTAPVPVQITRERKYGDRMVSLREMHPHGPVPVTVRFTVCRRAVRVLNENGRIPRDTTLKPILTPDRLVPVGGRFRTLADRITRRDTTALAKEHALFDSVVATMHYDYDHHSPEYGQGSAAFVCDYKDGNCSDLHSYLVSLSRSLGIPAVMDFGFPLTGIPIPAKIPVNGAVTGYHCWVWFQTPSHGWVPLDAADARRWQDAKRPDVRDDLFGNLVLARTAVTMSRGRDIILSPPQQGKPLNYFIYPYAEADGKPLNATWTLTYHLPTGGKS